MAINITIDQTNDGVWFFIKFDDGLPGLHLSRTDIEIFRNTLDKALAKHQPTGEQRSKGIRKGRAILKAMGHE